MFIPESTSLRGPISPARASGALVWGYASRGLCSPTVSLVLASAPGGYEIGLCAVGSLLSSDTAGLGRPSSF